MPASSPAAPAIRVKCESCRGWYTPATARGLEMRLCRSCRSALASAREQRKRAGSRDEPAGGNVAVAAACDEETG
jgi:hypothetical protein